VARDRAGSPGGLTYLFTDIEGSTRLVQTPTTGYGLALRIHRHMLATCVEEYGGQTVRGSEGDGSFFVFPSATDGVIAAVAAQRKIEHHEWPEGLQIRVRMGIHTGPAVLSGGEHVGLSVHEAARISAGAHGGQILCSGTTARAADVAAEGIELRELGTYVLRGIPTPHVLHQVCTGDLVDDFPPPRGASREGGRLVSIWRREADDCGGALPCPTFEFHAPDGSELPDDVAVDVLPASDEIGAAFRLVISVDGVIEEEFDGLTIGGASDAARILSQHSRIVRLGPAVAR
jgi:class 3 adenylate cyclase